MGYIHGDDRNFEKALWFLMNHAHEISEGFSAEGVVYSVRERNKETWRIVFNELIRVLSPMQIQQLFERLVGDFMQTGMQMVAMAESQKLLQEDVGGETG